MRSSYTRFLLLLLLTFFHSCIQEKDEREAPLQISGIYPHLAMYNNEDECGTGAVVPWNERLWVITYGPHLPMGSSDKLYEITPDLEQIIRPESIGGTPANRMVHKESNQLFIGPYAIDSFGEVRVISYEEMTGRHTGNARHLYIPDSMIYYGTMEEGFYEVNVYSLGVTTLFEDSYNLEPAQYGQLLPGAHGKGLYSGQGVLVFSNNGESSVEAREKFDVESGVLAEWDGNKWKVIRRAQFVEVTGPGGIFGNTNPETDPIWVTGWDHKSALVGSRNAGTRQWEFFRIPKASHSYDGAHGWNTEWPRIRDIGTSEDPVHLMTMHGMFWWFPSTFDSGSAIGIRPASAYLKVIGDFARWKDQIVFGCDDAARKEFLNKRSIKGEIHGAGQSNSNLWWLSPEKIDDLGPVTANGAVWLNEILASASVSEAFLMAGWSERNAWVSNKGRSEATLIFQLDESGKGEWTDYLEFSIGPDEDLHFSLPPELNSEWIRVKTKHNFTGSVQFSYAAPETRYSSPDKIFHGISKIDEEEKTAGILYALPGNRRSLGVAILDDNSSGRGEKIFYELNGAMELKREEDSATWNYMNKYFTIPENAVIIDHSSVLIVDDRGRRWRLPLGDSAFSSPTRRGEFRIAREVSTERDLLNCHGTFYELPAENADGFAKIRPVSSHNFRIPDFAGYRGLLVMSGADPKASRGNPHIFTSDDSKVALWAGSIDDLWRMGKPIGKGGPWYQTSVPANLPSDPYLIGFYDHRKLTLSHSSRENVFFTLEVDVSGHGPWMKYQRIKVSPGQEYVYEFPASFEARWIRFVTDKTTIATAWLEYN